MAAAAHTKFGNRIQLPLRLVFFGVKEIHGTWRCEEIVPKRKPVCLLTILTSKQNVAEELILPAFFVKAIKEVI